MLKFYFRLSLVVVPFLALMLLGGGGSHVASAHTVVSPLPAKCLSIPVTRDGGIVYTKNGASSQLIIKNTCNRPIDGSLQLNVSIMNCKFGNKSIGAYQRDVATLDYTLGPANGTAGMDKSQKTVSWEIAGSCWLCNCPQGVEPPTSDFDLFAWVSDRGQTNMDATGEPVLLNYQQPHFLGSEYKSPSCGEDVRGGLTFPFDTPTYGV
jgi:hypothetical protein